jgi:hypothetical protein
MKKKNKRRRRLQARPCTTPACGRITLRSTCERCRYEEAARLAREAIATAAKVTVD